MKSLKIAALGVAALGFAALPVAGAFADAPAMDTASVSSHTDAISINVNSSCTLGSITNGIYGDKTATATDQTAHAGGSYTNVKTGDTTYGTWANGTSAPEGMRTDKLSATMQPGTSTADLGSTTFTIRCNNAAGFSVSAVSGIKENISSTDKAVLKSANGTYIVSDAPTGWAANTGASYWNFKAVAGENSDITIASGYGSAAAVPATATPIASTSAAGNLNDGQSFTVTYGAGINNTQESGTYEGSVVYTLAQLEASGS